MKSVAKPVTILVADDDADDRKLTAEAFAESKLLNDLRFVENGVEVLDYLNRRGKFADPLSSPWPSLLLLDLNMPKMDGREVLEELKKDDRFAGLRVIVMTTSKSEADINKAYLCNAASYITKPITFDTLVNVVTTLGRYWLEIVELPDNDTPHEVPALRS
jgi:CheY-like chemotaxis protein